MYITCEASSWTLLHQNGSYTNEFLCRTDCSACADYQPWYTHPDIQSLHHLPRPNCGDYLDMRGISEGKLIRILENTEFMLNMWLDCSKCLKLLCLCIDTTETKWGGLCAYVQICALEDHYYFLIHDVYWKCAVYLKIKECLSCFHICDCV